MLEKKMLKKKMLKKNAKKKSYYNSKFKLVSLIYY